MMRGKRTQATPKPNKNPPNKNQNQKPKHHQGPEAGSPSSKVFPLYEGETIEKAEPDCVLTMGLNSLRKSVGKVSARAECCGANQRGLAPPTKL